MFLGFFSLKSHANGLYIYNESQHPLVYTLHYYAGTKITHSIPASSTGKINMAHANWENSSVTDKLNNITITINKSTFTSGVGVSHNYFAAGGKLENTKSDKGIFYWVDHTGSDEGSGHWTSVKLHIWTLPHVKSKSTT